MAGLPRTRRQGSRALSISSVTAFASAAPHGWRRPHRVALILLAVLILLTLSALEIGGRAALSEPRSSAEEPSVRTQEDVMEGVNTTVEPAPVQLGVVEVTEAERQLGEPADAEEVRGPAEEAGRGGDAVAADEPAPLRVVEVEEKEAPVCKRTLLFRFAGLHGFGSEVNLLLRASAVAAHFGYAVFLDSTSWNYGAWDNYFLPLDSPFPPFSTTGGALPNCRLPSTPTRRYKMALTPDEHAAIAEPVDPVASAFVPRWTRFDHTVWYSRDMDGLDVTFNRLFVDAAELESLHRDELDDLTRNPAKPLFLSPARTLSAVHEQGFRQLSRLAELAWRPNERVRELVQGLERRLALPAKNAGGVRKAGNLLIGVHVRLGDKFLEKDHIGPAALAPGVAVSPMSSTANPGLRHDFITSYFAASIDSVNSLLSLPPITRRLASAHSSADRIRLLLSLSAIWASPDPREKPTLALMSDDYTAIEAFRAHPLAKRFRIVGTNGVPGPAASEEDADIAPQDGAREAEEPLAEDVDDEPLEDEHLDVKRMRRRARRSRRQQVLSGNSPLHSITKKSSTPRRKAAGNNVEIPPGFTEGSFNALPLSSRLSSASLFVRDLTVLAGRSDALVVTGTSNVGRLMMLLFESAKEERGSVKRELRSLDTRWFPTARFT